MADALAGVYTFNIVINCILTVASLILIILFSIRISKSYDDARQETKKCNGTNILSFTVFILGFLWFAGVSLMAICTISLNYYTTATTECDAEVIIRTWLLAAFQHALILFWYYRIKIAFDNSIFALTKFQNRFAICFISASFIIWCVSLVLLTSEVYPVKVTLNNSKTYSYVCRPADPKLKTFFGSIMIITLNILSASVFISKLRQLAGNTYDSTSNQPSPV